MNNLSPRSKTILLSILLTLAIVAVIGFNLSRSGLPEVTAQRLTALGHASQPEFIGPPEAPPAVPASPSYQSSAMAIVKMLGALALVIVCIYGGLHLVKKSMGRMQRQAGRSKMIEVLETQYVGPKKAVSLVRVGNRAVLLGVTDGTINVLTELTPDELVIQGTEVSATLASPVKVNFAASLKKAAGETIRSFRHKRAVVGTQ